MEDHIAPAGWARLGEVKHLLPGDGVVNPEIQAAPERRALDLQVAHVLTRHVHLKLSKGCAQAPVVRRWLDRDLAAPVGRSEPEQAPDARTPHLLDHVAGAVLDAQAERRPGAVEADGQRRRDRVPPPAAVGHRAVPAHGHTVGCRLDLRDRLGLPFHEVRRRLRQGHEQAEALGRFRKTAQVDRTLPVLQPHQCSTRAVQLEPASGVLQHDWRAAGRGPWQRDQQGQCHERRKTSRSDHRTVLHDLDTGVGSVDPVGIPARGTTARAGHLYYRGQHGQRPSAIGHRPSAIGHRPSVISHRSSAIVRLTMPVPVCQESSESRVAGLGPTGEAAVDLAGTPGPCQPRSAT